MPDPNLHLHPILGSLRYDGEGEFWLGSMTMMSFSTYGIPVSEQFARFNTPEIREEIRQFHEGRFHVLIYTLGRNTPSRAQNDALAFLLENEEDVCQSVLTELCVALEADGLPALRPQIWLRQIEVADEESGGVAYAGFTFSTAPGEESPICIIYHPTKGLWWAESSFFEALDLGLEPADSGV